MEATETPERIARYAIEIVSNLVELKLKSIQWNDRLGTGHVTRSESEGYVFEVHFNTMMLSQCGLTAIQVTDTFKRDLEKLMKVKHFNSNGPMVFAHVIP